MAQVATNTSERIDHLLSVLSMYLGAAAETERDWDTLDRSDRLDFVHEWGLVLSHWSVLHDRLAHLELTQEQRRAYQSLAAEMERLQPFLDRVLSE
jgi:hypothetical protein